jgi:hypothetical protein
MNMILMVEYPTLKFSKIAAGMISINMIQLQLFLNQPSLSVRFRISINAIEQRPQGNNRKLDGFEGCIAMVICLRQEIRYFF